MSVLITGASSGIGEACARLFAEAQFNLVLVARREESIAKLTRELTIQYGVSIRYFPLDVQKPKEIDLLLEAHPKIFESVDVLINNAGLAKGLEPIQSGHLADWDSMIDTNIKGLLYMTRAMLPGFIARKKGHVINMSSVSGHWVYEKGNVYCATKHAVHALTEGMRLDLKGTGIRVTEISPGMTKTEFSEVRLGNKKKGDAVYEGKNPLTATDVAEAVLWSVKRPAHVNIQEIILFPTEQAAVR